MARPCLGYPSRTEAVMALREEGLSHREVARKMGVRLGDVHTMERMRQRRAEHPHRTISFSLDVLGALGPHAARRGVHPNALARLIVATVVGDDMVDAVLDDIDDLHECRP